MLQEMNMDLDQLWKYIEFHLLLVILLLYKKRQIRLILVYLWVGGLTTLLIFISVHFFSFNFYYKTIPFRPLVVFFSIKLIDWKFFSTFYKFQSKDMRVKLQKVS